MWMHCIIFVTMMLNIVEIYILVWSTPTDAYLRFTLDISVFLQFEWWEQVYYLDDDRSGFSNSKEKLVHCCVPTDNCCDAMKYWIFKPDIKQIISRIVVRPDTEPNKTNKRSVSDPYYLRNYNTKYDTHTKGREKG